MVVFAICIVVTVALLALLLGYLTLPAFPDIVMTVWDTMLSAIESGLGILYNFVDKPLVVAIVGISLSIWIGYRIYLLVLWIIKKFPFDIG